MNRCLLVDLGIDAGVFLVETVHFAGVSRVQLGPQMNNTLERSRGLVENEHAIVENFPVDVLPLRRERARDHNAGVRGVLEVNAEIEGSLALRGQRTGQNARALNVFHNEPGIARAHHDCVQLESRGFRVRAGNRLILQRLIADNRLGRVLRGGGDETDIGEQIDERETQREQESDHHRTKLRHGFAS